jgi:hypothetical protein
MFFDHAQFAYTPSFRDARSKAAPVYPDWLLPLAQSALATAADKALEQEIASGEEHRAEMRLVMADALHPMRLPLGFDPSEATLTKV